MAYTHTAHSRPDSTERVEGRIERVLVEKSFGFIRDADGQEYFFHETEWDGGIRFADLTRGQKVDFVPSEGKKGWRALEVRNI